jgi:hypothetical protein
MNAWKRITLSCLSLLVLGLAPIGAAFAQVKVTAASPSSASQGTVSLDVIVTGSGFDRTAKATYYVSGTTSTGGVTVKGNAFKSSTELVTTIDVADAALLASFDIVVTLDSGRKGKGTTLFSVTAKATKSTPTYPQARFYQAFASNDGTTSQTSKLYMFGGMANSGTVIGDLWSYANAGSTGATWTYIPGGTSAPSPRRSLGWSCGAGLCVAANGATGASMPVETWLFSESTRTWTQATCGRRALCPSARMGPAMAYDPSHGVHVLFGGDGWTNGLLADTYTFNTSTKTWTQVIGGAAPPARTAAAAVYVPGTGVVMSGGWGNTCCTETLNDMYVWNGTAWGSVASTVISDPPRAVPTLANHSMAWDATRNALIVTGGFLTSWHTPNTETWYVTISKSAAGAWQATWTLASGIGCQSAAGSPPDPVVHPGAMMARDAVGRVQVFFGGETPDGNSSYGNTVECR